MKRKYTEQDYFALSESDMEELEEVCEMMNSLSLELSFGKTQNKKLIIDIF